AAGALPPEARGTGTGKLGAVGGVFGLDRLMSGRPPNALGASPNPSRSPRTVCTAPCSPFPPGSIPARLVPTLQTDHHRRGRIMYLRATAAALALVAASAVPAAGQSVQYRSPAGVEYRSQPDTGAVARAEAALAADPRNVDLIIALGLAQSGVRQYREAIATFSRGLKIAPGHAMLLRWRGHRYLSIREFDRATADLEAGIKVDPTIHGL